MSFWGTVSMMAGAKLKDMAVKKGKEGIKKGREGAKNAGKSMNFFNAPKDSPGDVFKGISNSFTKSPDKINLSPDVKKYVKDTFRLK